MKNLIRIFSVLVCLFIILSGCTAPKKTDKLSITVTNFAEYDFARAVAGEMAEISLLIPPGNDMHSFEPTLQSIAGIENSDLIIYIGGESDSWIERILASVKSDGLTTLKMSDYVCLAAHDEHEHHDHASTHEEYDEHIWTSPENAEKMINAICNLLCEKDSANADYFRENADDYIGKIKSAAEDIKNVVDTAKTRTLPIADRNPYKYFTDYFGLSPVAAFSGCSEDTDADLSTVIKLIEAVNKGGARAVFVTELGNRSLADKVAESTGAKILTLHSYHNISSDDFSNGVTYLDLMNRNKSVLLEGLN